jgi:hypothetical protein
VRVQTVGVHAEATRLVTKNVGKNWSGVRGFEALPKRQLVTESININSLADRHIWSTIKTLPATLPEPRTVVRGPRPEFEGPRPSSLGPWTPDRGYWSRLSARFGCLLGGRGGYKGLGSCALDLGSGIVEGGEA